MNIKLFLLLIFINVIGLSGCEKNEMLNNVHNEVNGLYASAYDNVYYVADKVLYQHKYGNNNELSENVMAIHEQNDIVYCICTENHVNHSLYKIIDEKLEWLFDLSSGTYQQSSIYNDKLYACINNEIIIYDLQTGENEKIPIENSVTRFVVDNNNLYYWDIGFPETSIDSYVNAMKSGEELPIFEGKLYSYDFSTNISSELLHSFSKTDTFFISATKYGIVFFDPDNKDINIYNGNIKTLYNGDISSMLTDDQNVYFSIDDNNIYRLDITTNDINVFIEGINIIKGMDEQYVFNGDSCIEIWDRLRID